MYYHPKKFRDYRRKKQQDDLSNSCAFCRDAQFADLVVKEHPTMYIVPNRTKYDYFETLPVLDHLMVVPKRHVETLADLTDEEMLDHMKILAEYESRGYSVYARGVGNIMRSVKHQHTHLIKLENKQRTKTYIFHAKPYTVIRR